jgi:hypothetical protein
VATNRPPPTAGGERRSCLVRGGDDPGPPRLPRTA